MTKTEDTCKVAGCDRQVRAKGWCQRHYQRVYLKGDPGPAGLVNQWPAPETCTVDGCDKPYVARGYCEMHRWRVRTYGEPGGAAARQAHTSSRKPPGTCQVDGCERKARIKGLCGLHYERQRRTGEVGPAEPLMVKGRIKPNKQGYRRMHAGNGRRVLEHVLVMEQRLGRRLVPPENVHHRNGHRDDNDRFCPVCVNVEFPQDLVAGMLQCSSCGGRFKPNLELWIVTQPSGQRVADLMEYIAEYHADAMRELLARR